jgi:hypothetical protein
MTSILGMSPQYADSAGKYLMIAGFIAGIIALVVSTASAFLLYKSSSVMQDEANQRIAEWTSKTEDAKAEAARANEAAANAKLEQEKIRAQLAWRTLNKDQFDSLVEAFKKHRGSINLVYGSNDSESQFLAIQFSKLFETAGWTISGSARTMPGIVFGILIPGKHSSRADVVRTEFTKVGIPFSMQDIPVNNPGISIDMGSDRNIASDVTIFIGSKPPPF